MKLRLEYEPITLSGRDNETFPFTGALVGHGSSERDEHNHRSPYAPAGTRCSACRWFEVHIYVTAAGTYVVHTVGESVVPGETRLSRISPTPSAYEVIELLTVRRREQEPFIAAQSSRALAQAAELDDGLRDAYINRAVV